jgi:lipopolysaccharide/colanic/teichoic acid biosynthesis glycosyltransferase
MLGRFFKRLMDLSVVVTAGVVLAPVLALLALVIRLTMGSPIFFRQHRLGYHGRSFVLLKFRSMRETNDSEGVSLPDRERLTRVGRFLRRTSMDELPQLWNVLRGDMSLVGPRPLPTDYLPVFADRERVRFTVRPGITGWAQIHGRNLVPWSERLERDAWYVEHWCLLLDLRILFHTVKSVYRGAGVAEDPQAVECRLDDERRSQKNLSLVCDLAEVLHDSL